MIAVKHKASNFKKLTYSPFKDNCRTKKQNYWPGQVRTYVCKNNGTDK